VTDVAWVTGAGGFSGRHLVARLQDDGWTCLTPSRDELDLLDAAAVRAFVADRAPDALFHLAALASVRWSWEHPRETLLDNVAMTVNALEAMRLEAPDARVLLASSGEIYGPPERLPVDETHPLRPQNPYAASKAACDLIAGQAADGHGLPIVRARAFNHAGPGQNEDYVIGAVTRQVAEAELRGADEVAIVTGNPDAERDFTDVRDVVGAYAAAIRCDPGVFNVASGSPVSVREVIRRLDGVTPLRVSHEVDPDRMRPADVPCIAGDAGRLREATGWAPSIPLEQTLRDAIDHWRDELG